MSCFVLNAVLNFIFVSFVPKVYVRKFGGFAMSHDDWKSQYDQLVADLQAAGVKYKGPGEWYHLSYDSPWTMKNRRNEVWAEVEQ